MHKESNWKSYTSSSDNLNRDIREIGHECFSFVVIEWCKSKSMMTYRECQELWLNEALSRELVPGTELRKWYNEAISAVKFLKPLK